MNNKSKGFTLIEILVIAAIIGILAVVMMTAWFISARNKAAVSSYKTSMRSLQTAMELCAGTGGTIQSGNPGNIICAGGTETYPQLSSKCNSSAPYFYVQNHGGDKWIITTSIDATGSVDWDCRGCRISCMVEECNFIETNPGDCY